MSSKVGDIELYMGPKETGAPDDLEGTIIEFIDGAKRSLRIAVQELDSISIAEAIMRARRRGVSVQITLELDYLRSHYAKKKPFEAGGQYEMNRKIYCALLRTAIPVKLDTNTHLFHHKFIIRDYKDVLTGSSNFTKTGVSRNLNDLIIIRDKTVARAYNAEFRSLDDPCSGINRASREVVVGTIPIKILFSPKDNPEMAIIKEVLKAEKQIDFAIFTFTTSSGIDDILIRLRKLGIKIGGALDTKQATQDWSATEGLKAGGITELYGVEQRGKVGKQHHKLMVIDQQVIITGSFNYTRAGNELNNENILVIGDLNTKDKKSIDAQKQLAQYAIAEINRIKKQFGTLL